MALLMPRKYFHWAASAGAFFIGYFAPYPFRIGLAGAVFLIMLILDLRRLKEPHLKEYHRGPWRLCLREIEKTRFTGSLWLTLGYLIISFIPEKEIVCLAVIYAGFADPMAEIFGHHIFSPHFPSSHKTWGGSFGFFLTGLALSLFTLKFLFPEPSWMKIWLSVSLFATFIEALEIKFLSYQVNDNLLVPVLTALFLKFFFFQT
ncbi:MAG: hypothetical protein WC528_03880 [Patescibacteria group bacterium]